MAYYLGVDAGNTKTVALIADSEGNVVGFGRSGPGDCYNCGSVEEARISWEDATRKAARHAGIPQDQISGAGLSMAGVDWPEDYEAVENAARAIIDCDMTVVNDGIGALRAGSTAGWGVAVVVGTWTATAAKSPDGRIWHSSFWQIIGGGADSLGSAALHAVFLAELAIGPPTDLTRRVLEFYGSWPAGGACLSRSEQSDALERLLHSFTRRDNPRPRSAAQLSRVVMDAAEDGDQVARAIVDQHGREIADIALAAARRVGVEKSRFPLVLAGGVMRHPSRRLTDAIVARMRSGSCDPIPVQADLEPVVGALLLAYDRAGLPSARLIDRLRQTLPPAEFFDT